jgi:hypothetical protein
MSQGKLSRSTHHSNAATIFFMETDDLNFRIFFVRFSTAAEKVGESFTKLAQFYGVLEQNIEDVLVSVLE